MSASLGLSVPFIFVFLNLHLRSKAGAQNTLLCFRINNLKPIHSAVADLSSSNIDTQFLFETSIWIRFFPADLRIFQGATSRTNGVDRCEKRLRKDFREAVRNETLAAAEDHVGSAEGGSVVFCVGLSFLCPFC